MHKNLHHILIGLVITVIASSMGTSPGPAASGHGELRASADASLPPGLLAAVSDTLGPQAAADLAGPAAQHAKLTAADAEPYDGFGWSVALSGDTALIGAPGEEPDLGSGPVASAGSAYVFLRSGVNWSQEAKLVAADAEVRDSFGASVAISGDTALVGASGEDPDLGAGPIENAGSVYVFV
jgi:hypothetical protein